MAEEAEQATGKHGSSRTFWNSNDTKLLVGILLDYKRKGEMRSNNFGKSWSKICKEFNAKAEIKQTKDQITQKFNRFRIEWRAFKDLCENHSGLGWDATKRTVTASDEQWSDLIKKNKDFKKFRLEGLEYHEELTEIFQKSIAIGQHAFAPGQNQTNKDPEMSIPDEFISLEDENDDSAVPVTSKSSGKRSFSGGSSNVQLESSKCKKIRTKTSKEDLYLEAATQACIAKTNKYAQAAVSMDEFSAEKCMDALYELENDIGDDLLFVKATRSFMDPEWRPLFMKMNRRHRLAWVKSL